MNNTYYPGNPQGGKQKKEIHNQFQAIGVLRSRSADENEPLKFIPWKSGGGVVNANLKITEPIGVDENGMPKTSKTSIPVSIKTNKNITVQTLQSLLSGTKVRIVARLKVETYESKTSNTRKSSLVAEAYVLEILEMPMQPAFHPQAQVPHYGQQYPQAPAYPGQAPAGYPAYPQVPPQYQNAPQYVQPGQQPTPQYYQQNPQPQPPQQPQQAPPSSYYPQSQQPPWYKPAPGPEIEDIPV